MDSILWFLVPLGALWWIKIGGLSGDGVVQSLAYTHRVWTINPNHLLYEPIGAGWLRLLHVTDELSAITQLKRLSILAGSLTLALFRLLVASQISRNRLEANIATAWLIASAAVLGLLLSDETEIIQLPSLVLLAAGILHYARSPSWRQAIILGATGGIAALFYISNVLICVCTIVTLAFILISRRDRSGAATLLLGSAGGGAVVLAPIMFAMWHSFAPRTVSFVQWLTSYGGGKTVPVGAAGYGVQFSAKAIGVALLRAAYGATTALVDISDAVTSTDHIGVHVWVSIIALLVAGCAIAFMLASAVRHEARSTRLWLLPLVLGWTSGVFLFAVYWNNSDDQFFFQLTIPLAVTAAAAMRVSLAPAVVGLVCLLGWNGYATAWAYITYPRSQYIAALSRASSDANLTIYPGDDDIDALMAFVPTDAVHQRVAVTRIAENLSPKLGIIFLRDTVTRVLEHGGTVSVIAVVDAPTNQNPWKYLQSLGYAHSVIASTLDGIDAYCETQAVGPWMSRRLILNSTAIIKTGKCRK